jgi:hypothetical protein
MWWLKSAAESVLVISAQPIHGAHHEHVAAPKHVKEAFAQSH